MTVINDFFFVFDFYGQLKMLKHTHRHTLQPAVVKNSVCVCVF